MAFSKLEALMRWVQTYGYDRMVNQLFDPKGHNGKDIVPWLKMMWDVDMAEVNTYDHHKTVDFFRDGKLVLSVTITPPANLVSPAKQMDSSYQLADKRFLRFNR